MDDLFAEDMLGDDLESWLLESAMMKGAFKSCALISGLVERRFRGDQKSGRQITFSTDLVYDVLRRHQPDHLLLRCARADAARGPGGRDAARPGLLARIKGRIRHAQARPPVAVLGADDPGDRPPALARRRAATCCSAWRPRTLIAEADGVSAEPAFRYAFAQSPCGGLAFELAGAEALLRPSGALWLPAERVLVVADLHLEKGSAYAARGQMLPPYDTRETLARLAAEVGRLDAPRHRALGRHAARPQGRGPARAGGRAGRWARWRRSPNWSGSSATTTRTGRERPAGPLDRFLDCRPA